MRPLEGVCPSGQRERAVNPSAQPTEVRILPPPSHLSRDPSSCDGNTVRRGVSDGRTDLTSGTAAGNDRRCPWAPRRRVGHGSLGRRVATLGSAALPRRVHLCRARSVRSATGSCRSAARRCTSRGSSSRSSRRRSGASSRSSRRTTSCRSRTRSLPRSSRSRSTGSPDRCGFRRRTRSSSRSTGSCCRNSSSRRSPRPTRSPTRWRSAPLPSRSSASMSRPPGDRSRSSPSPLLATLARVEYFALAPAYLIAAVVLDRRDAWRRHRVALVCARSRIRTRRAVRLRLLPDRPTRGGPAHQLRQLVLRAVVPGRTRARRRDRAWRAGGSDQLAHPAGGCLRSLLRCLLRCSS